MTTKEGTPNVLHPTLLTDKDKSILKGISCVRRLLETLKVLPGQTKTVGAYKVPMNGNQVSIFLKKVKLLNFESNVLNMI